MKKCINFFSCSLEWAGKWNYSVGSVTVGVLKFESYFVVLMESECVTVIPVYSSPLGKRKRMDSEVCDHSVMKNN